MRILNVRQGFEQQDIATGRQALAAEIADPDKTLFLVRGDATQAGRLASRGARLSDTVGWRETLWLQDTRLFTAGQEAALFGNDPAVSGVILGFDDQVVERFKADASLYDLEMAFLEAMQQGAA